MKRISILTALILTFITTGNCQTKNFIDQPYIEMVGYNDTLITPNQIFLKIDIREKDSKSSVEEQEKKMISVLKSLKINVEEDLEVTDLLSNYKLHLLKGKDVLKSKEYILKVINAAIANAVLIKLEEIGISNIVIDRVEHSEIERIQRICNAKAVKNAQERANEMAKVLQQSLGNAIHIVNHTNDKDLNLQGRTAGVRIRGTSSVKQHDIEVASILEFEKIKVKSCVSVSFILK